MNIMSSSSDIPVLVPFGSKTTTNKKKKRPTFRPGGEKGSIRRPSTASSSVDKNLSLSQNEQQQQSIEPSNAIQESTTATATYTDEGDAVVTSTGPLSVAEKNSNDKEQSSGTVAKTTSRLDDNIQQEISTVLEHAIPTSSQSTVPAAKSQEPSNISTTTAAVAASVVATTNGKVRRRPISLSRLDAARKQKKKKTIGVPISGGGNVVSAPHDNNENYGSTKTVEMRNSAQQNHHHLHDPKENIDVGESLSLMLLSSVSENPSAMGNAVCGTMVNLSHHPLIQIAPEMPTNTTDKPSMSDFCSRFKVKRIADATKGKKKKNADANNSNQRDRQRRDRTFPDNNVTNRRNPDGAPTASVVPAANKGPIVQIVNGEIVLQESSLDYYENNSNMNHDDQNAEAYTIVEEEAQLAIVNASYNSFLPEHKQRRGNVWNDRETVLFYKALRQVGTDFCMMEAYFRGDDIGAGEIPPNEPDPRLAIRPRTRKQLKRKYQMELARNPKLIERATDPYAKLDIDLSVFQLTEQAVIKVAEERAERERKERAIAEAAAAMEEAQRSLNENNDNDEISVVEEDDNAVVQQHRQRQQAIRASQERMNDMVSNGDNNESMWSIFADGPPPEDMENHEEHRDDEPDAGFEEEKQYFEDPLLAADTSEQFDASTNNETGNDGNNDATIALLPTLGGGSGATKKSTKKKIKPNFRKSMKK